LAFSALHSTDVLREILREVMRKNVEARGRPVWNSPPPRPAHAWSLTLNSR